MPRARLASAVEQGWDLSALPDYLCKDAIDAERVQLVLAPKEPVTNDLWFVVQRKGSREMSG